MTVDITSVQVEKASVALIRNWPLTALCAALLPLLIALGFWQLQRAEEKAAMNAAIDARLSAQPRSLTNNAAELKQWQTYTPVRLLGHYTNEFYYLDNRTRGGRVGYEILQLFVSGKQRWLVNRGWMPAGSDRAQLPQVAYPLAAKVIIGFLYPVAEASASPQSGPAQPGARVQQLDTGLTAGLELARPAWCLRLSADSDTALVTDWQLINMPPQRHRAYAAQWFAMAAALVILWLLAATHLPQRLRKKEE